MDKIFDLEMNVPPDATQLHLTGIAVDHQEVQETIDGKNEVEKAGEEVRRLLNKPDEC